MTVLIKYTRPACLSIRADNIFGAIGLDKPAIQMSNVQKDEDIVRQYENDKEIVEDVDETLNEKQKVNHKKSQSYRSAVEAGFEFSTLHLSKDEDELYSNKCSETTCKKKKNRPASFLDIFTKKFPETEKTQSKMVTKVRRYKVG